MNRVVTFVLGLLAVVLAACGGKGGGLAGTWVLDWKASMPPEQREAMAKMPPEAVAQMEKSTKVEIEFRGDGTGHGNASGAGEGEFRWHEKDGVVTIEGASGTPGEFRLRDGALYVKVPGQTFEAVFRRK